jgi:uncharacterized Tic20 family protein
MEPNESNNDKAAAPSSGDKLADTLNKYLKVEDGPAFGAGKLSAEDDKLYCGLAHPFSLIIWLWKRKESPAVDVHGKEALNAAITIFLCVTLPLSIIVRWILGPLFIKIGLWWLLSLVWSLISLAILALFIYGLIKAREGKLLKYPFNLRLIK